MNETIMLARLPTQRWKNGAGVTRELAVEPPGAGFDRFDWRVSIAEVERDGPFSAFPGIDRCIVLLRGAGLQLSNPEHGIEHRLDRPLQPFRFPGEAALQARCLGGPSSDFNVMTRRGRWRSDLLALDAPSRLEPADALMLLAVAGHWRADGEALEPGRALLRREGSAALVVDPAAGEARPRLLALRLLREAEA